MVSLGVRGWEGLIEVIVAAPYNEADKGATILAYLIDMGYVKEPSFTLSFFRFSQTG
jgi:hypothetical protein